MNIITNYVSPKGWCDAIYCVKHYVISRSTLLYAHENQQVFIRRGRKALKHLLLLYTIVLSGTLRKVLVDQKYLGSSEMWCWRMMEKIIWIDHVRNKEILCRVKEEWNILHTVQRRKANWIGHIFLRNCLLKYAIEGKIEGRIEVTGRRGKDVSNYWMTFRKREDFGN